MNYDIYYLEFQGYQIKNESIDHEIDNNETFLKIT